jgi:hypothetical protein
MNKGQPSGCDIETESIDHIILQLVMPDSIHAETYQQAQEGIMKLKAAVLRTIENGPTEGMTNVEIGRNLGIYAGHEGHEGHIPRTILALLEQEGVVTQDDESKRWTVQTHS